MQTTITEMNQTLITNVTSLLVMTQAFRDTVAKSKNPKIVNVSSFLGSIGANPNKYFAYGVSKAAVNKCK